MPATHSSLKGIHVEREHIRKQRAKVLFAVAAAETEASPARALFSIWMWAKSNDNSGNCLAWKRTLNVLRRFALTRSTLGPLPTTTTTTTTLSLLLSHSLSTCSRRLSYDVVVCVWVCVGGGMLVAFAKWAKQNKKGKNIHACVCVQQKCTAAGGALPCSSSTHWQLQEKYASNFCIYGMAMTFALPLPQPLLLPLPLPLALPSMLLLKRQEFCTDLALLMRITAALRDFAITACIFMCLCVCVCECVA